MKINYEITVDVSNADIETKKRVQDAFFKLGIMWAESGDNIRHLDEMIYTNRHISGVVTEFLMFCRYTMKATHTIDQLLELAGMKTKTYLIPFDLEKALKGEPVITRDGCDVSQVTLFDCGVEYPIRAVIRDLIKSFDKNGRFYGESEDSKYDLFMKPKTRIINGFEVPAPETKAPDRRVEYYLPNVESSELYGSYVWHSDDVDNRILSRNILFLTKEAAIANAKAMLGIDPYGDDD